MDLPNGSIAALCQQQLRSVGCHDFITFSPAGGSSEFEHSHLLVERKRELRPACLHAAERIETQDSRTRHTKLVREHQIVLQLRHVAPIEDREDIRLDAGFQQMTDPGAGRFETSIDTGEIIVRCGGCAHDVDQHASDTDPLEPRGHTPIDERAVRSKQRHHLRRAVCENFQEVGPRQRLPTLDVE